MFESLYKKEDWLLETQPVERVLALAAEGLEEKLLRAYISALSKEDKEVLRKRKHPFIITRLLDSIVWEEWQMEHRYDIKPQPKYRPVDELLEEFNGVGKKQAARKELQVRLPYLTAYEQKQIIYTFLDTEVKTDRVFVLKYLDKHFDTMYLKAVEVIWDLYHDFEAAKVLTHYAPIEFVIENQNQLAKDYRYFPVRLRLPADTPVDRSRLEMHELIHLCACQHLPLSDEDAWSILSCTLLHSLEVQTSFHKDFTLLDLPYVGSVIWALGKLGNTYTLAYFYMANEASKPMFNSGKDTESIRKDVYELLNYMRFADLGLNTKEFVKQSGN